MTSMAALLRFTPPSGQNRALSFPSPLSSSPPQIHNRSIYLTNPTTHLPQRLKLSFAGGDGIVGGGSGGGSSGGGGSENWGGADSNDDGKSKDSSFGILGLFLNGWRSRVAADP
ncbi:putative transmembrane protein, partial [Trifolium medium]|nr:putative transmembrane protein [Trifolium medium]